MTYRALVSSLASSIFFRTKDCLLLIFPILGFLDFAKNIMTVNFFLHASITISFLHVELQLINA